MCLLHNKKDIWLDFSKPRELMVYLAVYTEYRQLLYYNNLIIIWHHYSNISRLRLNRERFIVCMLSGFGFFLIDYVR